MPVLLWAAEWTRDPSVNDMNPGYALPHDQAVLLARYMVARWDAYPVAWMLPGDGPYTGAHAERWRRIGADVFGAVDHAPVTLHPNGMQWYGPEFDDQDWLDFLGYQSGHGDDDATVRWLVEGPPATGWQQLRPRPIVNLEPPYEGHVAYQSKQPFSAADVRKRLAWSLLVSPMAGVTYGGHGVWDWGDGTHEPLNHPGTGVPDGLAAGGADARRRGTRAHGPAPGGDRLVAAHACTRAGHRGSPAATATSPRPAAHGET